LYYTGDVEAQHVQRGFSDQDDGEASNLTYSVSGNPDMRVSGRVVKRLHTRRGLTGIFGPLKF